MKMLQWLKVFLFSCHGSTLNHCNLMLYTLPKEPEGRSDARCLCSRGWVPQVSIETGRSLLGELYLVASLSSLDIHDVFRVVVTDLGPDYHQLSWALQLVEASSGFRGYLTSAIYISIFPQGFLPFLPAWYVQLLFFGFYPHASGFEQLAMLNLIVMY